ncbi:MAG: TonB-dependent receptor plug domain-containing protein [Bacteroidales bacterium]|nr:TonB-dependent receptor plug domain-containing protein [Bacteroidales bacterium]MDD4384886.1 TonB-dependent receptor plug domain-containing protein [Bacteroidales bacterium]MDY0197014.1 TonB-dependent receptor plug domain-containing protein [Tenuifilaceae bacterium]
MAKRIGIVAFFTLFTLISFSQGIQDSTFQIKEVEIVAERNFRKEKGGMKETWVDTLVLLQKANLSLSELLSENTPVFIKSHGRGALATASFRGTAASHVQVKWNGININSPMTGMVDFSLIPVYVIDDMNLKHGGASIADNSGGLGGSIEINNKVDWDKKYSVKYMQGFGSYASFDELLSVGFGNKRIQFKTRLYHNYSKNDYTFINRGVGNINPETGVVTNPLDTNDNANYTKYGILQELYFRAGEKEVFSAKYWGQWADRTIPRATSYEGPDNSNLNNQIDNDHKVVADWKHYSSNSNFSVRTGYSQKQLDYTLKNYVLGSGQVLAIDSKSFAKSLYNSANYTLNINKTLSIESSLDVNYHDVDTHEAVKRTGYKKQRFEVSVFFAVRKSYNDRLNLNLMVRQERIDNSFAPIIPFLGFDFRIIKGKDLLLKGNIARNYHHPSLNDLYWQPGGNPDLLPEEGISGELGLEYQKTYQGHLLKSELTAYRSDINDWIIWIPSYKGFWEPRNIKRVLTQGIEFKVSLDGRINRLKYKLAGNFAFTPSLNYGDPSVWGDLSYGKQLVYVPLQSNNIMVSLSYLGFFATYQFNHYGERFTTSSNDFTRRDWLYPYFMNDLILGKDFHISNIHLSAEFKIYNLFNETYHSILYRPMPGRNYMFLLMFNI